MVTAIHVEINLLLLIILLTITYQSRKNVNQQMNRVLFRNLAEGIILSLCLDITWLLLEGHTFRGARMLNCIANALFLAIGVAIGCVWYLYVLETLGYEISRLIVFIIMLPGILSAALCLLSVRTGWVFTINESNHYVRGSYFQVQEMLDGETSDLILCGHTHIPCGYQTLSKQTVVNVGSVGRPMTGIPKANYAIFDFNNGSFTVEHREVEYDYNLAAQLIRARKFEGADNLADQITNPVVRHL